VRKLSCAAIFCHGHALSQVLAIAPALLRKKSRRFKVCFFDCALVL
jgi:hypothetical protein